MAKKIIGIYMITCLVNSKRYIGQSIDIKRRFSQHRRKPPNQMLEDFEQYGVDAFKFEILEECAANELDKKETAYMNELQPEYNIRTEEHGISDEAREKLRRLQTGRKRPTISRQVKCVETGEIFPSITATAEHYGLNLPNISAVLNGSNNTCSGFHWQYVDGQPPQARSEEFRNKIGKSVRCIETGIIYSSISTAAEAFGVTDSAIGKVLNGRAEKSCG